MLLMLVDSLTEYEPLNEWEIYDNTGNFATRQMYKFCDYEGFLHHISVYDSTLFEKFSLYYKCSLCKNQIETKALMGNLSRILSIQFYISGNNKGTIVLKVDCPIKKLIVSLYLDTIFCSKCFPIHQKNLTNFSILKNYLNNEKFVYNFFVKNIKRYTFNNKPYNNINFINNLPKQYINLIYNFLLINNINKFYIPEDIINLILKNMIYLLKYD
jgi:hypothetical protein